MWTFRGCILASLIAFTIMAGPYSQAFPVYTSGFRHISTGPDIGDVLTQINSTTLQAYDSAIQDFGPHPTNSPVLNQVEQYLVGQLSKTTLLVRQLTWSSHLYHGVNIEATLEGGSAAHNILLLCAHYDSVLVSPGADDDGSGVSALLACANVLSHYQFNCTIKFVFFSGEEQGLLGSGVYAKQARANHDNLIGVIALDGIGHCDPNTTAHNMYVMIDPSAAWMVSHSLAIQASYPDLINLTVLSKMSTKDSDHQSFINQGYPGECFREEVLDPFYHTNQDTTVFVNFSYLTSMCRLAVGTAFSIAGMNRTLSSDDLSMSLFGSLSSRLTFCTLVVKNAKGQEPTANLSVNLAVFNRKTGDVLKTKENVSLNWTLPAAVGSSWVFKIERRTLAPQRVLVCATATGAGNDEGLYCHLERKGFILDHWFLILT